MIDIIYIRTSTKDQNPENQLSDIMSIAPKGSLVYEEKQSAWKDHIRMRPKFSEIKELVLKGKVNSINVWDLDRVYRNRKKTIAFLKLCNTKGVMFRSFRQSWLSEFENIPAPFDEIVKDLVIQILAWINEEESNKKSERVKAAYQNHKGDWGRPKHDIDIHPLIELRKKGFSIRQISKQTGLSNYAVHSRLKNIPLSNGKNLTSEEAENVKFLSFIKSKTKSFFKQKNGE